MEAVNWAAALQGIGAILSVVVTIIGYIFIVSQIRQTNKSIQHSSSVAIYSISSDFYKFIADNSELRPYFYDNKELDEEDINTQKLLATCEYLADFFEFVLIESKSLDSRIFESWKDYMNEIHLNSPIFRKYLLKYEKNYTRELIDSFNQRS